MSGDGLQLHLLLLVFVCLDNPYQYLIILPTRGHLESIIYILYVMMNYLTQYLAADFEHLDSGNLSN